MKHEEIKKALSSFRLDVLPRLKKLASYYEGRHPILETVKEDGKPNHRLVNNFAKSITDATVGYFMGKPVVYASDDKSFARAVGAINAYNDEEFVNSAIARDLSVYGRAAEILYYDEDREIRFAPVDPETVIPIYADTIDETLSAAIRFYPKGEDEIVEVYDDYEVVTYVYSGDKLTETGRSAHYFGQVPINFYANNADKSGDFESVLTLIDAYNVLQSESVNDFSLFADSYLAITGMNATEEDEIAKLREERVLLLDDGGDAKWLTKSVNDTYIENLKSRVASDIYRFSGSVDMNAEDLGPASLSGIAIRYRLLTFENRVSVTERYFKKGLSRRYELICAMLHTLGADYDWRTLRMHFTRNLPASPAEDATFYEKLAPLVSKRTLLERMPFISDVGEELDRIDEEETYGEEI